MPLVKAKLSSGVRVLSDQKRAEEILERMGITPHKRVGRFPLECLRADSAPGFPNLPTQNDRSDGGTDIPDARDNGRRLIYRGVNFVIGSLREVRLRDRGNAYHGA